MRNYISIQEACEHTIEIKKSKFICFLYPIFSEEEFEANYQLLKKEHYKANHLCYAYILGENSMTQRMSDDGEPTGTAGIPMLEVLKKRDLTNIMAVSVRYFGGVKLGASGLIRAYTSSVSEALDLATFIQNIDQSIIQVELAYANNDPFNFFLTQLDFPVTILDTAYTDIVTYQLSLSVDHVPLFKKQLTERLNNQFEWQELGQQTIDIPL